MIAPKVSLEADVVSLGLGWECFVILHDLVWIRVLACVILDVLDLLIELVLEHAHGVNWILEDVVGEPSIELAQFIKINVESCSLCVGDVVDRLSHLPLVQVVCDHALHGFLGHC